MKTPNFEDLILLEDDDVIAVNKPPFVSSLEDRSDKESSMIRLAKNYNESCQICHRLDKETSGVLLFAKNPISYRSINQQFEKRRIKKVYHAVIEGVHEFNGLLVNLPILSSAKGKVKIDRKEGKRAETIFNSITFFRHYTKLECMPITGRMHQIRIHLATQRAVIAGDVMYGGKMPMLSALKRKYRSSKDEEEQPIIKRFALHANALQFTALDDRLISVIAPYPKDFATFIKLLEKFDA